MLLHQLCQQLAQTGAGHYLPYSDHNQPPGKKFVFMSERDNFPGENKWAVDYELEPTNDGQWALDDNLDTTSEHP